MDERLVRLLDWSRRDLTRIDNDLRWAFALGYWPAGRGLDAVPGAALPPPDPENSERAQRATTNIPGLAGDPRARAALNALPPALAAAEAHFDAAVLIVAAQRRQPVLSRPKRGATVHTLLACVLGMRWRVDRLAEDLPAADLAEQRLARRELELAERRLQDVVGALSKALDRGRATEAHRSGQVHGEKPCRNCKRQPRAEGRKRCSACQRWWERNGSERPVAQAKQELDDAYDAQARRLERGEGWGSG